MYVSSEFGSSTLKIFSSFLYFQSSLLKYNNHFSISTLQCLLFNNIYGACMPLLGHEGSQGDHATLFPKTLRQWVLQLIRCSTFTFLFDVGHITHTCTQHSPSSVIPSIRHASLSSRSSYFLVLRQCVLLLIRCSTFTFLFDVGHITHTCTQHSPSSVSPSICHASLSSGSSYFLVSSLLVSPQ